MATRQISQILQSILPTVLELITLVLAILVVAMTVHASILSSPSKQRKWFLVYLVVALVLLIWQFVLIHKDNAKKSEQEAGLRSQISLLINAAKLQASVDDVHAIQKSIELGFERLAGRSPGHRTQLSKPKSEVEPTPPRVNHIRFVQRPTVSDKPDAPYGTQVIIQTDMEIKPVAFSLDCDAPIEQANQFIAGQMAYVNVISGYSADRRTFFFSFSQPSMTPESSLVVTLFSKSNIHVLNVVRGTSLQWVDVKPTISSAPQIFSAEGLITGNSFGTKRGDVYLHVRVKASAQRGPYRPDGAVGPDRLLGAMDLTNKLSIADDVQEWTQKSIRIKFPKGYWQGLTSRMNEVAQQRNVSAPSPEDLELGVIVIAFGDDRIPEFNDFFYGRK